MMMRLSSSYSSFLTVVSVLLLVGCTTTKDPNDKLSTLLRVHLEAASNAGMTPTKIEVCRESPLLLSVEPLYLITEKNVVSARVVDQMGTYAIEIQLDHWAAPLLDHRSSSWQGRRMAIQASWGRKYEHTRWLAAPVMDRHIDDGRITFTPDATLEEAYEIVTGLNNNARKAKRQLAW